MVQQVNHINFSFNNCLLVLLNDFSNEWRHVNTLVNSNENEDHVQALKCLHLWKIRTPLLFAGIEGTIIILEALTSEKDTLQEDQIKQIYALSLMRYV